MLMTGGRGQSCSPGRERWGLVNEKEQLWTGDRMVRNAERMGADTDRLDSVVEVKGHQLREDTGRRIRDSRTQDKL